MSSIIEGYNYDIFISYRQKDNKHDGWVTEFVNQLKGELEATFKEDISIYFDVNPSDGLLETHSVDKSLEGKLRCLIFIPIISQTYCDSNSFAWQHEFCAFNKLVKEDQFGRDIRLSSSNVASRILPVKIHDLDPEDKTLFENEIGGSIRGIEFIYKEPGVNRPLKPEDDEKKNLNNTIYRNQINKVANAVKEIISALKKRSNHPEVVTKDDLEIKPVHYKNFRTKIIGGSLILLALVIAGYFIIPKLFRTSKKVDKSIAVLPFSDFSANHDQEYFANGMMEEILNQLSRIKDLEVISRTSSMIYKDSKLPLKNIAHELGVSNIVEGSVQKAGDRVRITVQLINGTTEKHLWSESFDRELSNIFSVQTEISMNIARELDAILSGQEEKQIQQIPTKDPMAYDYYLKGLQYASDLQLDSAIKMYNKAIDQDPVFELAYLARSRQYSNIFFTKDEYHDVGNWKDFDHLARADFEKAIKINPELPDVKYTQARLAYNLDHNNDKALELLNELITQTPNNSGYIQLKCWVLRRKGLWQEHLQEMQKAFLLDPLNGNRFIESGHTYRLLRRYPEAIDLLNKPQVLRIQLGPRTEIRFAKFLTIILWKGNVQEALKISGLNNSELGRNDYVGNSYYYYNREFDKLIPAADKTETQFKYFPKTLNLAQAYFYEGNNSLSKCYSDSAIKELNIKIREFPDDDRYYAALGYAYAYKGDYKKAIENAQKAVKFKPMKMDVWQGFEKEMDLVSVLILAGEYDQAMDKIEYLLTIPGDLSVPMLKIDPAYDKLRSLPRFQKILTTEYKTNY